MLVRDGNEYKEETVTVTLMEDPNAEQKKAENEENSGEDENLVEDWEEGQQEEGNSSEEDSADGFRGFFGDWK